VAGELDMTLLIEENSSSGVWCTVEGKEEKGVWRER